MTDLERIGALAVKAHVARQAYRNADQNPYFTRDDPEWQKARKDYHSAMDELSEAIRCYEPADLVRVDAK